MIGAMDRNIHFVPGSLVFTGGLENQYQGGPVLVAGPELHRPAESDNQ